MILLTNKNKSFNLSIVLMKRAIAQVLEIK